MIYAQVHKIKAIQNSQNSLGWGSSTTDKDNEMLYAVGHKFFPGVVMFFKVSEVKKKYNLIVFDAESEGHERIVVSTKDYDVIIKNVVKCLKEWFPANVESPPVINPKVVGQVTLDNPVISH